MEIHILKEYCGVHTLCKTGKTDYYSLSFDYNNICDDCMHDCFDDWSEMNLS